jgi:hypothetical protein
MTHYDELFKPYLSADNYRPALQQPNRIGHYVYATDAHQFIRVPFSRLEKLYECHPKCPDIERIVPVSHMEFSIRTDVLAEKMAAVPRVEEYEQCSECHGDGNVHCLCCGNTHKCSECEGKGHTKKVIGTIPDPRLKIEILGSHFNARFVENLFITAQKMNADEIVLRASKQGSVSLFQINDVLVGIMSMMMYEIDSQTCISFFHQTS